MWGLRGWPLKQLKIHIIAYNQPTLSPVPLYPGFCICSASNQLHISLKKLTYKWIQIYLVLQSLYFPCQIFHFSHFQIVFFHSPIQKTLFLFLYFAKYFKHTYLKILSDFQKWLFVFWVQNFLLAEPTDALPHFPRMQACNSQPQPQLQLIPWALFLRI